MLNRVLPIFDAHPLSSVFTNIPLMLVEGDDEERIWQQSVRSSHGRIRLNPLSVGGKQNLTPYEIQAQEIMRAVYDSATAYSLRDRDGGPEEIDDLEPVTRFRLACRASENLLLSDEMLDRLGLNWNEVMEGIDDWLHKNPEHRHFGAMRKFRDDGYNRKSFDIKELRNDLMGIMGSEKAWEVVVGQTIGQLEWSNPIDFDAEGSLASFLGRKLVNAMLTKKSATEPVTNHPETNEQAAAALPDH